MSNAQESAQAGGSLGERSAAEGASPVAAVIVSALEPPTPSNDRKQDGRAAPARRQPGTSRWAVAALVCSTAVFCPPLSLLGLVLSIRAWFHVRALPGRRGAALAAAAFALGLAGTVGSIWVAFWWNGAVRRPILEGPVDALVAGLVHDDAEGFRRSFAGADRTDPVEAIAFLDELRDRYGTWTGLRQATGEEVRERLGPRPAGPLLRDGGLEVPYVLEFAAGPVHALARFVLFDDGSDGLVLQFGWILVRDEVRGDLRWPPLRES